VHTAVSAQWATAFGFSSVAETQEFHHCSARSYTGRSSRAADWIQKAIFVCFRKTAISLSDSLWRDLNLAVINQFRRLASGSQLIGYLSNDFDRVLKSPIQCKLTASLANAVGHCHRLSRLSVNTQNEMRVPMVAQYSGATWQSAISSKDEGPVCLALNRGDYCKT
jgi:hypothetical protein